MNSKSREQDLGAGMGQFSQGGKPTIDVWSATWTQTLTDSFLVDGKKFLWFEDFPVLKEGGTLFSLLFFNSESKFATHLNLQHTKILQNLQYGISY